MFKILIAEDEPKIRRGLKNLILSFDLPPLSIELAADGREALEQAVLHSPDMFIVDINMPIVNGLAFINQVKKILPDAFIIILSGYDDFSFAQEAIRLKVEDYLLKPVDEDQLYGLIQRAMPKEPVGISDRMKVYIDENYGNPHLSLEQMGNHFGVSTSYITRMMKEELGISFIDYLTRVRITAACDLIKKADLGVKIYEIAEQVGYNSQHYFSRVFKRTMDKTPLEYKKGITQG